MKINSDKILFTRLGDEGVIYDTENNEYFGLNETFIKILNGIEDGLDEAAIVTSLCEEYDIPAEACKTEVQEALKVLIAKGYIG